MLCKMTQTVLRSCYCIQNSEVQSSKEYKNEKIISCDNYSRSGKQKLYFLYIFIRTINIFVHYILKRLYLYLKLVNRNVLSKSLKCFKPIFQPPLNLLAKFTQPLLLVPPPSRNWIPLLPTQSSQSTT